MSATLIEDLFRQNEWANLRLLRVCRTLSDAQLDANAVGAYGTIRDTLVHLLAAEQRYVERLGGEPDGPHVHEQQGFPGFPALEACASATAAGMIERAGVALGGRVERDLSGGRFEIDTEVIFVQSLNHSIEHRSQVNTILTALEVEPADVGGWAWGEATGRMRPR